MKHLEKTKEKFGEVADLQEGKGIIKYGHPLDPLEGRDWLKMCLEEQVDGTKYLVAEMEKRKFIVNKIRSLIEYQPLDSCNAEIHRWLDELEGAK